VALVPVDHDVQGSWSQLISGINPGSEFRFTLTETSGVVTGTGTFAGEAAAGGSLVISGSVRHDSLHLQVVFVYNPRFTSIPPRTASFEGALVARDTIDGMLQGYVARLQLVRVPAGDSR
jgi:hypothetical protein